MPVTTSARLLGSHMISRNVRHFRLALDNEFHFRPGEFISLQLNDEQGAFRRSYSLASIHSTPVKTTEIELVASYVENGRATRWLWNAAPGTALEFTGPNGMLVLPEAMPKRLFLIATGTGVAPYRAMLNAMQPVLQQDHEIHVLFGVRQRDEAFFVDDFRKQAMSYPHFHFHLCLSRDTPETADEYNGRVTQRLHALQPEATSDMVYLCGNPAMVDETFEALKQQGFTNKTVRREKYIFTRN